MKVLTAGAVAAFALPFASRAHADDAGETSLTIAQTDTAAPAEMQANVAGIEACTRCLRIAGTGADQ